MKLSIDGFNISLAHGTGVATYGRNLAKAATGLGHEAGILFGAKAGHSKVSLLNEIALAEVSPVEAKRRSLPELTQGALRAVKRITIGEAARTVRISGQVILPQNLQLDSAFFWNVRNLYTAADLAFRVSGAFSQVKLPEVELAHWTYPLPVRIPGARNVYTLHDLVPLRLPYTTADVKRSYYALCKRIARDADHIITVSECSRRDIIEILGVDEGRVTNLYQSSDVGDLLGDNSEAEIARYVEGLLGVGLREYFLFFGAIEPKKNVARLLEAFLGSGSNTPLVIVGAPGWGGERDAKLLKSMTLLDNRRRIIWLGYLPRDMLARLIAGAKATLFPSLYEGFGLPVLESMALGTPVLTSNISSIPEVGGDAALYINPYDVQSIAAAIMTLDADAGLRAGLSERGLQQAQRFNIQAYQARLAEFYQGLR
ncbi:MAG: glycosyltransferase family 1 protein [Novosphingobium sp.]|uniref:glycosyltransferase family 4 protein n=1 Tax=Novosphingobium sp. TaxID=1874826 RepID=UPI0032B7CDC2